MARPPGKCLFCGNGGMSKAHIFPEWLGDLIEERTDRHIEQVGHFETFTPNMRMAAAPWERVRQGDSGTRKVRKVCQGCNSGWMSEIETAAKPLVIGLMNGDVYCSM